jgi:predicted DCC family thiol-disulfide oxidoreductase YuxK
MNKPIIFFDGVCNLCNASVQFILKRDKNELFLFSALQSDFSKAELSKYNIEKEYLESIILLEDNTIYTKSSAGLRVAKKLSGLWPLLSILLIVPKFLRDWVYDIIANNRYKWWGKQDSCWVPTPDLKRRFL